MSGSLDADVTTRGMHFHHRAAPIEPSFCDQGFWTPLIAFAAYVYVSKIGSDAVAIAHIHGGAQIQRHVRGNVESNIARARLQFGVAALATGVYQFDCNPAGTRLCGR